MRTSYVCLFSPWPLWGSIKSDPINQWWTCSLPVLSAGSKMGQDPAGTQTRRETDWRADTRLVNYRVSTRSSEYPLLIPHPRRTLAVSHFKQYKNTHTLLWLKEQALPCFNACSYMLNGGRKGFATTNTTCFWHRASQKNKNKKANAATVLCIRSTLDA